MEADPQSYYFTAGNFSDFTLKFEDKSWQIHKALACCHSKWFQAALTSGFKSESGTITLKDDPAFADAIDCMVSYFYNAGDTASKYGTSESSLHAQVAIIADKYDRATLYKLAKIAFGDTVKTVEGDDWVAIAELIYDYTTTEAQAHADLRNSVISAVAARPAVLQKTLQSERAVDVLRSNADLATDLLLYGVRQPVVKQGDGTKHISYCTGCGYGHVGSDACSNVWRDYSCGWERDCAQCGGGCIPATLEAFHCPTCNGMHTKRP